MFQIQIKIGFCIGGEIKLTQRWVSNLVCTHALQGAERSVLMSIIDGLWLMVAQ